MFKLPLGLIFVYLLIICFKSTAQDFKVEWMNASSKKVDFGKQFITADHNGSYFQDVSMPFGAYQPAYKLRAFDSKLKQLYFKDFRKEMKGFVFHSFQS
jgi:hypothetical protein